MVMLLIVTSCTKDNNANTVTDIDGNVYNTVKIGSQTWMAENLKVTKFNDGSAIPLVTDGGAWVTLTSPGYCWYNDSVSHKNPYGAMYNWSAVNHGKLCPTGWHVPSDTDWKTLSDYLGGISVSGNNLKETGSLHWNSPNAGATNESKFTALPGGYRSANSGAFFSMRDNGSWWTSTADGSTNAMMRAITLYGTSDLQVISADIRYGISVRCIKD